MQQQMAHNLSPYIYDAAVLVVEDNEISRIFLENTLRIQGFSNILAVDNAISALEALDEFKPDIVLLDIVMPGMDGFECCREIRKRPKHRDLPVLVQTIITDPSLRVKAFHSGATDLVSKPLYPEEVCARVQVHLEKRLSLQGLLFYRDRVQTELQTARELQLSVLPTEEELQDIKKASKLSLSSYFQPSSEIGGDFWGIKNVSDGLTAIWLVDFSGHGVASALNSFRLQAHLKDDSELIESPGNYLTLLNDKLLKLLQRGQFATMFYGIIDRKEKQLRYACACAPSPIILRGKEDRADIIDGSGSPLGIAQQKYITQTVSFGKGDTLLLYSDALTETPNAQNQYLSEDTIANAMLVVCNKPAENIKDSWCKLFKWHARNLVEDDLTLVVAKCL